MSCYFRYTMPLFIANSDTFRSFKTGLWLENLRTQITKSKIAIPASRHARGVVLCAGEDPVGPRGSPTVDGSVLRVILGKTEA